MTSRTQNSSNAKTLLIWLGGAVAVIGLVAIVGGDGIEPCISAASIIAKEWRDRMMLEAEQAHPQYGWERNKGYGTAEHMEALRRHGPTPLHRQSFAPVAQMALL